MKKILITIILISLFCIEKTISQQNQNPVDWKFEISDTTNVMGLYEITFTATIQKKWHMYSQHLPSPDEGPLPTVFSFDNKNKKYEIVGKVVETTTPKLVHDDVFEVDVNYFENKAIFKQLIRVKETNIDVKGYVSYMVCNGNTCLPPVDIPFVLKIK